MAAKVWKRQEEDKWLTLLRSGDHKAFAEFIDKYKETVFLCCRTLGLRQDEAEDVASETFLAAYRAIRRYSGRAELSTWLWSIAYRRGVSYLRKNRREYQLEAELDGRIDDDKEPGPVAAAQSREEGTMVWDAVKRLPRLWAMAIVLHYREEKNVADVARIMRLKQNTIKTYLFRGRERLKEMLAPTVGDNVDVGR